MNKILVTMSFIVAMSISSFSMAAEQTIKLSVPGMTCASCPYMVKNAVSMVGGVKAVSATMEDRSATVTFDDTLTNIKIIQQATADIGYPSTLYKQGSGS